jgi:plasmid stabilization system protein ParE
MVIVSAAAESDLESIGDWIGEQNPDRAFTFVRELRERCYGLADLPKAYPLVPRYEHTGIRRRPYGDYLIFYRIDKQTIEIVRVIHGARNYETILFRAD